MKKIYSLIKASLSEGMSLFKLKQIDKQSNIRKKIISSFSIFNCYVWDRNICLFNC